MAFPLPLLPLLPVAGVLTYLVLQHTWLALRAKRDHFHGGVAALCFTVLCFVVGRMIQLRGGDLEHARLGITVQLVALFAMAGYVIWTIELESGRRLPRWLVLVPATALLLLFTSNALVTDAVLPRVGVFGNAYYAVGSGPLTYALLPACVLGTIWWFRYAQQRENLKGWSRRTWLLAAAGGTAAALHDIGMNQGLFRSMHLIEYAGIGSVFALSQLATRRSRDQIVGLETAVRRRTKQLAENHARLAQAAAAHQKSEERYRQLAELTTEGVVVVQQGRIVDANKAAMSMWQRPAAELTAVPLLDMVAPRDRARVAACLDAPPGHAIECAIRRRGSTDLSVELDARIQGEDVVVLIRDLTERKELQSRLLVADRMAALGTLAAGVAHEINNPLTYVFTNVQVATELAKQEDLRAGQILDCLADAASGCRRVQGIVDDLRKLSRESATDRAAVEVVPIVEGCLAVANNEIRHRARVELHFAPVRPVLANEGRLAQVILNLLINAAQAMPPGQVERMKLTVSVLEEAEDVVVEVRDTGCGISADVRERMFDPFFTTKDPGVGTGLGLSICHSIVTSMGGSIQVDSEVGQGTTFRVRLPAAERTAVASPPPEPPPPEISEASILIVDDEPSVRRAVARALRGNTLVLANGADEALELCSAARFDAIFCDVMMPGKSGIEFYEALAVRDPELASRVVFITGGAYTETARSFLANVANPTVPKPFDVSVLRNALRRVVSRAEARVVH